MNNLMKTVFVAATVVAAVTACNQPPAVNPWVDDSIGPQTWATPSEQGVLAAGHEPVITHRESPQQDLRYARSTVPHYPLYWQDPFTYKGNSDKQFAWTWEDYVAMPYGLGRFILNTVAVPVSVVVYPPGTSWVSDGTIQGDYDGHPGTSPDPVAGPADFDYVTETQPAAGG
jgi:hypothetical protein